MSDERTKLSVDLVKLMSGCLPQEFVQKMFEFDLIDASEVDPVSLDMQLA